MSTVASGSSTVSEVETVKDVESEEFDMKNIEREGSTMKMLQSDDENIKLKNDIKQIMNEMTDYNSESFEDDTSSNSLIIEKNNEKLSEKSDVSQKDRRNGKTKQKNGKSSVKQNKHQKAESYEKAESSSAQSESSAMKDSLDESSTNESQSSKSSTLTASISGSSRGSRRKYSTEREKYSGRIKHHRQQHLFNSDANEHDHNHLKERGKSVVSKRRRQSSEEMKTRSQISTNKQSKLSDPFSTVSNISKSFDSTKTDSLNDEERHNFDDLKKNLEKILRIFLDKITTERKSTLVLKESAAVQTDECETVAYLPSTFVPLLFHDLEGKNFGSHCICVCLKRYVYIVYLMHVSIQYNA